MTIQEFKQRRQTFGDPEAYDAAREQFFREHPDCPRPKPIERLDLIMRVEYAIDILRGRKKVEIRNSSPFYWKRLHDPDVMAYEDKYWDDELMRLQMLDFNDSVRAVETIHFHNYSNSWYLDVKCIDNNTVLLVDDQVAFLREAYGFTEFDEELEMLNKRKAKERPLYFYFTIGDILGTNLE